MNPCVVWQCVALYGVILQKELEVAAHTVVQKAVLLLRLGKFLGNKLPAVRSYGRVDFDDALVCQFVHEVIDSCVTHALRYVLSEQA